MSDSESDESCIVLDKCTANSDRSLPGSKTVPGRTIGIAVETNVQVERSNERAGTMEATLRDYVDMMETCLAAALKDYRMRAEEILEDHYEAVEKAQNKFEHTISLLRSENSQLRKIVGVKVPEESMAQSILFQTMAPEGPTDRKAAAKAAQRGGDDEKQLMTVRKKNRQGKEADPNQQAGGSWQQFMAWVPNGAALQQPEPWKPLPPQQQLAPNSPMKKGDVMGSRGHKSVVATSAMQMQGVLPGSVDSTDEDGLGDDLESNESGKTRIGKEQLEVVDTWKLNTRETRKLAEEAQVDHRLSGDPSEFSAFNEIDETNEGEARANKPKYILDPDSNVRISWDLASLFLVVYDMIMIPMITFDLPESAFSMTMDWTTRLFWTFDMGWSCCTGVVHDDGRVEYSPKFILRKYAKSWFPLDVFIVGSDWFGFIFQSGGASLSRLARASRVARVVRLLRLVRMQEIVAGIMERISNDKVILLLHVLKLAMFLVVMCHVMACLWWGIGDRDIEVGETWVHKYRYSSKDVGTCYLASLHWALAQFGGGMEEILPMNGLERLYVILTWVFAFMAGLIMLSFLASTMTQQYIIGGSGARQMATLKKYLNQNKVPKNLVKRLCRNAKHAISGDLTPDAVDLLHVVSEPLQIEMHFEMYSRTLASHPFFHELLNLTSHLTRRVCHSAMSTLWLASGDIMFTEGEELSEPKMIFVVHGNLNYTDDYGEKSQVTDRMWVSEGVLWTSWKQMGTLVAAGDVKLALLDALTFQEICDKFMKKAKDVSLHIKRYAKHFIEELNQMDHYDDIGDQG